MKARSSGIDTTIRRGDEAAVATVLSWIRERIADASISLEPAKGSPFWMRSPAVIETIQALRSDHPRTRLAYLSRIDSRIRGIQKRTRRGAVKSVMAILSHDYWQCIAPIWDAIDRKQTK